VAALVAVAVVVAEAEAAAAVVVVEAEAVVVVTTKLLQHLAAAVAVVARLKLIHRRLALHCILTVT